MECSSQQGKGKTQQKRLPESWWKGCYPVGIGQQENREKRPRLPIAMVFVKAKSQGVAQESKIRELSAAIKCRVVGPLFLWALHLYTTRRNQRYLEQ